MAANGKVGVLTIALTLAACSSSRLVQVPPRVDLGDLGTIGMMEFRSLDGRPELSREANRRFLTELHSAQPGVPVLELGEAVPALEGATARGLAPETVRAIGEKHRVDVLLFGVLEAKEVKPKVSIGGGLESLSARAEIEGTLTAKLYDTRTGATVWTCATTDKRTIAALSVSSGGLAGGGSVDADGSRSELFQALVVRATDDFRSSWKRVED